MNVTTRMTARCGGCPWIGDRTDAATHEADTGHRVTVWDTPTSQLPRQLWRGQERDCE